MLALRINTGSKAAKRNSSVQKCDIYVVKCIMRVGVCGFVWPERMKVTSGEVERQRENRRPHLPGEMAWS